MKTKRKTLLFLIPILLVLLSCSCFNSNSLGDSKDQEETPFLTEVVQSEATLETEVPTQAVETPTQSIPDLAVIYSETISESQENPMYSLEIAYPRLEGDSDFETFNQGILEEVNQTKAAFVELAEENEEWRSENMPEMGNEMALTYEALNANQGLISIRFSFYEYIVGCAHPNSFQFTSNYDLNTQSFLTLDDLFTPGSAYLEEISEYCISYLEENGTLDWPESGANPVPENYENWNIQEDGLLITFNPYQIAAYAVGPQWVSVPYSELLPYIDEDSPLNRILE